MLSLLQIAGHEGFEKSDFVPPTCRHCPLGRRKCRQRALHHNKNAVYDRGPRVRIGGSRTHNNEYVLKTVSGKAYLEPCFLVV